MKTRNQRFAAPVLLACAFAFGAAHAQQQPEFITGGVGSEQREEMKAQRGEYNLQLTFAETDGELMNGVAVTVRDRSGNTVLEVPEAGPMVYAKLQPGTYKISATAEGKEQVRTATVGHGPRALMFHWTVQEQIAQQ